MGGVPKLVFMDSEKSRWFSWIVRSETDCHGREHGNNFGVRQHQKQEHKRSAREQRNNQGNHKYQKFSLCEANIMYTVLLLLW